MWVNSANTTHKIIIIITVGAMLVLFLPSSPITPVYGELAVRSSLLHPFIS